MELKWLKVSIKDVELLNKIESTYISSFPIEERRDFDSIRDLLSNEHKFSIYALMKDDEYVGFFSVWIFDKFSYGEHFAIESDARNSGTGGKALDILMKMLESPFIIEVELPTEEMSKRRIGFYERHGFLLDNNVYYQPPYRKGSESIEMRLMTNNMNLKDSFDSVRSVIHRNVYGVVD